MLGTVTKIKRWDPTSNTGGYGFLRDDGGYDRFFHSRDLADGPHAFGDTITEGSRVSFEPTAGNTGRTGTSNGLRAIRVMLEGEAA